MLLLKNADIYTPAPGGRADVLMAGGRIEQHRPVACRSRRPGARRSTPPGYLAVPGFIDGHVHLMGGGGEGGYATRTPELALSDAIRGGVTTLVGCLGTDGVTRNPAGLLAKARGLDEEGLSTFIYTGHYSVPVHTLTGSIERDLLLIDKIIGVGEVALSDHRSTQPTFDEFARVAAEARRGGILSGKAGVVNVHMGDGRRGPGPARPDCGRDRDSDHAVPADAHQPEPVRCSTKGSRGRNAADWWTSRRPPCRRSSRRAR